MQHKPKSIRIRLAMDESDYPEEILSDDLFRELASELLVPINPGIDAETKCQLYLSKLLYLESMRKKAFALINLPQTESTNFTTEDLKTLRAATVFTNSELKIHLLENLRNAINVAEMKGYYAS